MKKWFYVLLIIMFLGHVLDYLTTYYVFEKGYGYLEVNKWIKNIDDLRIVKQLGFIHAVSVFGVYFIILDKVKKKYHKLLFIMVLIGYCIPTFMLWNAVIVNLRNCLLISGL